MTETTTPTTPRTPIREFYRDNRYRTVGEQYNNLGNIEQGGSGIWPGQIGIGWNSRNTAFKAFATVEDGSAAHAYLLERYVFQQGHQTFGEIIGTYAPTSDGNNVPEYTAHVSGRVDAIARSLGYTGPAITGQTNLRELLENPQYRDVVLAATIKAMNEVEVGSETSNRVAPASRILAAIRSKYANDNGQPHTAFQRYSRQIGRDPGIRAPSARRSGTADTSDGEWTQPDDQAIDDVGNRMMGMFLFLLFAMFLGPDNARSLMTSLHNVAPRTIPAPPSADASADTTPPAPAAPGQPAPPAPALPADARLTDLIAPSLLVSLGITAQNRHEIDLFDADHNGHITREEVLRFNLDNTGASRDKLDAADLTAIAARLHAANPTAAVPTDPSALLTAFAALPAVPAPVTPPAQPSTPPRQ